ncbi:MAG: HGGxSTG domain-containing protein [Candidatus Hydrogenedentes bacterium]|nr:HGGxSTG domain-containing protein [Candidatus Hydrogenedentota bacterium]
MIDSGPRQTPLGTPCSPAWDDAHIALVEAEETKRESRICGARTLSSGVCALAPNHDNGRCKFHGGFDLTGGQPGNRNAVIHGLYSRCVQACGDQCPMWKTCPCAGPEVLKLSPPDRPRCPYETVEYNTALTDSLSKLDRHQHDDATLRHTAHHVAMLQVMLLRAAAAIAENPFIDNAVTTTGNYHKIHRKESPYLLAFMRITSELRRTLKLLEPKSPRALSVPERHAQLHRA